jgi:hypothetical protein
MTDNVRPETSSGILVIRRGDLSAIECILRAGEAYDGRTLGDSTVS